MVSRSKFRDDIVLKLRNQMVTRCDQETVACNWDLFIYTNENWLFNWIFKTIWKPGCNQSGYVKITTLLHAVFIYEFCYFGCELLIP